VLIGIGLRGGCAGCFVRDIGTLRPNEGRWVFIVPPVYGGGEFSFRVAGRTHRIDVGDATYAMGIVWAIKVDANLRATSEVKFSIL
jgi:hypothetical protein